MSLYKKYTLNTETLLYEIEERPLKEVILRLSLILLGCVALSVLYFWVYIALLGFDPPKTAILKRENARWRAKISVMNRDLDECEASLTELELRGDDVYRSIFGMNSIPQEVLKAGFGGVNRYDWFQGIGSGSELETTFKRIDVLTKQTYVESKSFDEISALSKRAGDMASCTPAICPVKPEPGKVRISSSFGARIDPVHGGWRFHEGIDFATKQGTPVYVAGDGVVETVKHMFFGYGNMIVVNHGFGYKTRYAHLFSTLVVEGMRVKRGECIATVGNTGKSTGPHLHYEVQYRGKCVNPFNFFDYEVSPEEYDEMVSVVDAGSEAILDPKFRYRR